MALAALVGWLPFVVILLMILPGRRGIIAAYILGWLFLPVTAIDLEGLPDYSKEFAVNVGTLAAIVLTGQGRGLATTRPRLFDIPILLWCVSPFVSSLANDQGVYDGLSATLNQSVVWGLAYWIGRAYFGDREGLKALALGVLVAGLIYAPFCLWEVRMSPRLHLIIYGFRQHSFRQTMRLGGYRPMVFLQHGLAVGLLMASATMFAFCLWRSRKLGSSQSGRESMQTPFGAIFAVLLAVTVLCKSLGALFLLLMVVWIHLRARPGRRQIWINALVLAIPAYLTLRLLVGWDGQVLNDLLAGWLPEERVRSLTSRMAEEADLRSRLFLKPVFGWGSRGWAVKDEMGRMESVVDSLWIITLARNGLIGVTLVFVSLLLPIVVAARRMRSWTTLRGSNSIVLGAVLVLLMFALDCVLNFMPNPLFLLVNGALIPALAHEKDGPPEPEAVRERTPSLPRPYYA